MRKGFVTYLILLGIALGVAVIATITYFTINSKSSPIPTPQEKIEQWETIVVETVSGFPAIQGQEDSIKLQLSSDGKVIYSDLRRKINEKGNLSPKELSEVDLLVNKSNFFSLKDKYSESCADCSTTKITLIKNILAFQTLGYHTSHYISL